MKPTLLLVEDDEVFARAIARALDQRGYAVNHTLSADAAAQAMAEGNFDYAILDLNLGGHTSLSLIQPLREVNPEMRILMLTGYASIATAVATIANEGRLVRPRLVRAVQDARTQEVRELPAKIGEALAIKPEHLKLVQEAMVDVSRPGGTAARAALGAPYLMAAKTGTAQVIALKSGEKYDEKRVKERHRDHALGPRAPDDVRCSGDAGAPG